MIKYLNGIVLSYKKEKYIKYFGVMVFITSNNYIKQSYKIAKFWCVGLHWDIRWTFGGYFNNKKNMSFKRKSVNQVKL